VSVLLVLAWVCWLTLFLSALVVPYAVGLGAVSCLPAIPTWVYTDVRLYFVGWMLLRAAKTYGPKLVDHFVRLCNYVSQDVRDFFVFFFSAQFLMLVFPMLCGYIVFLETAFLESDFPPAKYCFVNNPTTLWVASTFLDDFLSKVSFSRAWLAGFPFTLLFSTKTHSGRQFWRFVFESKLVRAGKSALWILAIGVLSVVLGIYLGIEFWGRAGLSFSPLSTVRVSVFLCLFSTQVPAYVIKYHETVRNACRRFHDTLKDEKYLMGRRLKNYDARV